MTLIISILMALGFLGKENESFDLNKIKTTRTYLSYYDKAGVHIDDNPTAWKRMVFRKY